MLTPFFVRVYFVCPARDSIVRICRSVNPIDMELVLDTSPEPITVALDSLPELKDASRYNTGHHSERLRVIGHPQAAAIQYSRASLYPRDPERFVRL